MEVSGPAVVVVSRPENHEAYVKEYFRAPERRERRVITFDKARCAFIGRTRRVAPKRRRRW